MKTKIAINGYGRVGRCILRAIYEYNRNDAFEIVAINDLGAHDAMRYLTQQDTAHGRFNAEVTLDEDHLIINGDRIKLFAEKDPEHLPWGELDVDVVMECTGVFRSRELAQKHVTAGAKKVIISAPATGEIDATIVFGVNDHTLTAEHQVISNASCTTNCLSPLAKALHEKIGIESGLMTTIHAYTNNQVLSDTYHKDLRRARAATLSQIPTKTGAAQAIGLVMPELNGKLDGYAMRIPTINVSAVDLTFVASQETSVEEVNEVVKSAADASSVLAYCDEPLVSIDFNHNPASSIYDATMTRVNQGKLVKVLAWYDNEWGFANRMLDVSKALMQA
ncbi:type I glyceraldehyde-3-phosphate dehydrogenase [Marinicella sp. S1101]|uniref:type I glyceraldehyde-3-phosphate dehydrogenase n=1 Tax=Marinicella marina TaxID=2996016 RepID=UPI002260B71A|nr:type I glyceraldehyde-3-phosphate dehydrogenase [Marinicella marina]MCX7554244.1 type I glyceraldehyde-3-phosphate dehydrogenase [Marinicella marina]MDJ1138763.1 type I glyceraldehyde-3-phosphate dehydrogenase [Marinicella marina]